MSAPLDRRLAAFRPDLADARLRGRVEASRFVEGRPTRVAWGLAPMRREPSPAAHLETEALCGETLRVFEEDAEGWCWAQLDRDGYVGYLPAAALASAEGPAPTHRVGAPVTLLFTGPDIKTPPLARLPMGARLAIGEAAEDRNARYGRVHPAGWVVLQHVEPLDRRETDFAAVAERFLGVPYLWGGKSWLGLDCTGLVQTALEACGIEAPRDSDMQERALGQALPEGATLSRGDLVYWRGHVGIMLDGERLLHANAHHMMVAVEPLAEARARYEARGVPVSSIRRMDGG